MHRLALFALPAVLIACAGAETTPAVAAASGVECRERAAATVSVAFDQTVARPIGTDLFGTQSYEVDAGGQTFQCLVDIDGEIFRFARI